LSSNRRRLRSLSWSSSAQLSPRTNRALHLSFFINSYIITRAICDAIKFALMSTTSHAPNQLFLGSFLHMDTNNTVFARIIRTKFNSKRFSSSINTDNDSVFGLSHPALSPTFPPLLAPRVSSCDDGQHSHSIFTTHSFIQLSPFAIQSRIYIQFGIFGNMVSHSINSTGIWLVGLLSFFGR